MKIENTSETRFKIFCFNREDSLEEALNKFLDKNPNILIQDMQFSTTRPPNPNQYNEYNEYTVLITYTDYSKLSHNLKGI